MSKKEYREAFRKNVTKKLLEFNPNIFEETKGLDKIIDNYFENEPITEQSIKRELNKKYPERFTSEIIEKMNKILEEQRSKQTKTD